ncbi:MAG: hypothetical protein Q4A01_12275 [Coriobacteriales bacterium]|nr:hypothetical protein [Coriobacteriales bacterium]
MYAADLWSDPSGSMRFFEERGLTDRHIVPLKADATARPSRPWRSTTFAPSP